MPDSHSVREELVFEHSPLTNGSATLFERVGRAHNNKFRVATQMVVYRGMGL
jgi:hypothetical protein